MPNYDEAIALGIGPQTDQNTVNANVRDATALISGPASVSGATGILLRSPEDLSQAYQRVESDGGSLPGFFTRQSGTFQRINPAVSFTIDMKGPEGSPVGVGDFDFEEYMEQILAGARLSAKTSSGSNTEYRFENVVANQYKTLKIWRGNNRNTGSTDESWTLVGCTFGLQWDYTSGEKAPLTVNVFASDVLYSSTDDFPSSTDFGEQAGSAPILAEAAAVLSEELRGFQTGNIAVAYDNADFLDSNVAGGVSTAPSGRSVTSSLDWIVENDSVDYPELLNDSFVAANKMAINFQLGTTVTPVAGNSIDFFIPHLRAEAQTKVDQAKVVRNISGYSVAGVDAAGDGEFILTSL